jgi:hypothetical protein
MLCKNLATEPHPQPSLLHFFHCFVFFFKNSGIKGLKLRRLPYLEYLSIHLLNGDNNNLFTSWDYYSRIIPKPGI